VSRQKRAGYAEAGHRLVAPLGLDFHVVPPFQRLEINNAEHQAAGVMRHHAMEQTQIGPPKAVQVEGGLQIKNWAFSLAF
jgi:hypothetical protein